MNLSILFQKSATKFSPLVFFLAINQLHEFVFYDINTIWGKSINQIKYLQIFQNNENVPSQNYDLPE